MRIVSILVLCNLFLVFAGRLGAEDEVKRPTEWAQALSKEGLPNFHKMDDVLYRGAQPDAEGMKNLEKMGIKTIINLRALHSDRDDLLGTSLNYVHIPVITWKIKEKHVLRFLKVVSNPENQPVFVHCQHGADRTGTMAAFYRMVIQGWSKEKALKELKEGGYNYHSIWKNIPKFIQEADIQAYRKKIKAKRSGGVAPPERLKENPVEVFLCFRWVFEGFATTSNRSYEICVQRHKA
jgi:protein tyrosine phosphatase (PTP) superfamily phosphohydrolase (DUF442 family)